MENLITVNYDNDRPLVSARELHTLLGVEKRFSAWFETNSKGFIENEDFTSVLSGTVVNNGAVKPLQDYQMTLDMEPVALSNMEQHPQAKALYALILNHVDNAVKSMGGGTLKD